MALVAPPNPPAPPGATRWTKPVTPEITGWSRSILNDPTGHPMFSTDWRVFPSGTALARVEWHTWTFRNGKRITGVFRGVTLYEMGNTGPGRAMRPTPDQVGAALVAVLPFFL